MFSQLSITPTTRVLSLQDAKALGKLGNIVAKHCFLPMFRHVSKSGQTRIGNICEKHRKTSNVSEFARKHFCFSGSKFYFRNNVSTGGQTWKHCQNIGQNLRFLTFFASLDERYDAKCSQN